MASKRKNVKIVFPQTIILIDDMYIIKRIFCVISFKVKLGQLIDKIVKMFLQETNKDRLVGFALGSFFHSSVPLNYLKISFNIFIANLFSSYHM